MTLDEEGLIQFNELKNIEEFHKKIVEFGLTVNQSKVYLYLSQAGVKTASDISKMLKIPRTETYHLLNSLQQKGIIETIMGKPTKYNSLSIQNALRILINNEQTRINELNSKKDEVINSWNMIPKHTSNNESHDSKFQTLQGNSILVKLNQMIKEAKNEIDILGTEADFIKLYHTDFIDELKRLKIRLKILSTFSEKGNYIFDQIPYEHLRKLDESNNGKFCFVIKDDEEVIFFINNPVISEMIAMWTDTKTFIATLKSLFSLIWAKAPKINSQGEDKEFNEEHYLHRIKEIEQEKIILNYLNTKISNQKKSTR